METPLEILAEPRRQAILQLIWDRECSAGEISASFDVSFSAVSQHLARMRTAQIVQVRKVGRKRYYRARKETLGPLADYFESLWRDRLGRLKQQAEAKKRNARNEP